MRFALQLDIINHHNINVLAFHNDQDINYMINIYSDSNQTALQVLQQNIANMDNTIILTEDFNIRDSDWEPSFRHYSSCKGTSRVMLSKLWGSESISGLLTDRVSYSHHSLASSICIMQYDAFYLLLEQLWLLIYIHVTVYVIVWYRVYILAMCYRYTSLES